MFYIIGLGNPGDKYQKTRHNIGRQVLESMATSDWEKDKLSNSLRSRIVLGPEVVELIRPETFMNRSGDTVKYLVDKEQVTPENLLVVHDDIDMPFGEIKIAQGRGAGGNNGVDSIIKQLGSKDFVRIRIGIAPKSIWNGKMKRPAGGGPLERFVLKPFSILERQELPNIIKKAEQIIESIVAEGVDLTMNKFN